MDEGEHRVGEVEGSYEQCQVSHYQADLKRNGRKGIFLWLRSERFDDVAYHSLGCGGGKVVRCLVAVPVVERRASNAQPQQDSHDVHDGVRELSLVLGGAEQVREQLDARVDEITDEHARRYDLSIWRLLLVKIPCAADTQEVTAIPESVQNQDDDVEDLKRLGNREMSHTSAYSYSYRKFFFVVISKAQRQPHLVG